MKTITITRELSLDCQLKLEYWFDWGTDQGFYEKTLNPDTNETVYIKLYES